MSDKSSIRISKFSGEKIDWKLWSELMRAKLMTLDLLEVIEKKPAEIPDKDADLTMKNVKELHDKNIRTYLELIGNVDMKARKGRMAINLIIATKTKDYPNGNAAQAWHNLSRKFEPKTSSEMGRLKLMYANARLNYKQDPDGFVDYMERLREQLNELGDHISSRTFLMDLVTKLGSGYDVVIEKI